MAYCPKCQTNVHPAFPDEGCNDKNCPLETPTRLSPGAPQLPIEEIAEPTHAPKEPEDSIFVRSLVGFRTSAGVVEITWGDKQVTIGTENAREVAQNILDASYAADTDAFLYQFAKDRLGGGVELAANMVQSFREYRQERKNAHNRDDG